MRFFLQLLNKIDISLENKSLQKKINYRRYNSYAGDLGGVRTNVLKQDFKTTKPYKKAGTDITMFKVKEEAVYLSGISSNGKKRRKI